MTESTWGKMFLSTKKVFFPAFTASRGRSSWIILMASPAAVASSSMEQFDMGKPVREEIMVWKLMRASRRPWDISA